MQEKGQKACELFEVLREKLTRIRIEDYGELEAEDERRLDALLAGLATSASSAPIRPLDVFNLNYSSGVSSVGVMVTYLIVLLQFKTGGNGTGALGQ